LNLFLKHIFNVIDRVHELLQDYKILDKVVPSYAVVGMQSVGKFISHIYPYVQAILLLSNFQQQRDSKWKYKLEYFFILQINAIKEI
jgi:hypothetical protein